jgi:hypothetical protein
MTEEEGINIEEFDFNEKSSHDHNMRMVDLAYCEMASKCKL